jgi:hypothetical protein
MQHTKKCPRKRTGFAGADTSTLAPIHGADYRAHTQQRQAAGRKPWHNRGTVHLNTLTNLAVASPTESGLLSCPIFRAGRVLCAADLGSFGQGAPVRKAGGATRLAFRTPCPPLVSLSASGGFLTYLGVRGHA